MSGWIKLHRKILDNPVVCKDSDHIAVWAYLLLNATHKEYPALFSGKKILLQPGQLITGRKTIADKFKIDESKVQRILKSFEIEHQIEQQKSNKNRLITVLSWRDYQDSEQQDEQQMNNKRTTDEQQVNTNKNVKNLKNDKNLIISSSTEESEISVMAAFTKSFGQLVMPETIRTYVKKLKEQGQTDEMIAELMLEAGESSSKPNLRFLEAIGSRWLENGITSRSQAKELKDSQKKQPVQFNKRSDKPIIPIVESNGTKVRAEEVEGFAEALALAEKIKADREAKERVNRETA